MISAKHPLLWIPLFSAPAGLLWAFQQFGLVALVLTLPAVFLVSGGLRLIYLPDIRAPRLLALGSVLGMVISLVLLFFSPQLGVLAMMIFAISFLIGGYAQIRRQPKIAGVPVPRISLAYSARVALDDFMLSTLAPALPSQMEFELAAEETQAAYTLFEQQGWLENPADFHQAPPSVKLTEMKPVRIAGLECQSLRFASEFEPKPGLPGRERFMAWKENHQCHATVVQTNTKAPWLLCVHGFGMGNPKMDIQAFKIPKLVKELGINAALIILPLHGARSPGGFSGDKFIGLSPLDFIHAEAQAIWDLRRLIGWMREQGAENIVVHGISLGAYTAALLSCLEAGIDAVIAGVPPTDIIATRDYIATSVERRLAGVAGLDSEQSRATHRVVSPLAMPSLVPRSGRYIYAASGDQFVPIEQVAALWQHWQQPEISWCTGGHVSALMQKAPRELVRGVLETA